MHTTLGIIMMAVTAIMLLGVSLKMFQIYQLSSYRAAGVINWLKITKLDYLARYFALAFLSFISMFVYIGCFHKYGYVRYIGYVFFILFSVLFMVVTGREENKTPLKYTARMKRLIAVTAVVELAASVGIAFLGHLFTVSYALFGVLPLFVPLFVTAAHFIVLPFETLNNEGYKKRAKKRLELMPQLIKIGITGSYGKTTAKNILAKMLEKKFKVCYSPQSYNTPMGISRVVNDELTYEDQVFIAEMGARYVGDIKELADIVKPNYGLITAIGKQHLETFGSYEAIKSTKFELVENLAVGGLAVFNGDSPDNAELYARCKAAKYITGGANVADATAYYENVTVTATGTEFDLSVMRATAHIRTALLGKHIPGLIAMCATVALSMGVSISEIAEAVSELEAVPHRLQLIEAPGMTVIDDAYNSNTEGAHNALLVLSKFDGVKVIVTPGLVELGQEEKQANTTFGTQIAQYADYALLVGSRGKDIAAGARSGGMDESRIFEAASLAEATEQLKTIVGNKVVLFENDLPDNY